MKSQELFDAMSAAVKAKGPEMVKLGGAVARMKLCTCSLTNRPRSVDHSRVGFAMSMLRLAALQLELRSSSS